ncbi:MAG: hypothetical protein ABR591_03170 [Candidatus Velthaea sp.]
MNVFERVRRVTIAGTIAGSIGVLLTGCVGSAAVLPPGLRKTPEHHASRLPTPTLAELTESANETPAAPAPVDVGGLVTDTHSLAGNIEQATLEFAAVRHALTLSAVAVLALGCVIAGLLVAVVAALSDMRRTAAARLAARATRAGAARNAARALPDSRRFAAPQIPASPISASALPQRATRRRRSPVPRTQRRALGTIAVADPLLSRSSRRVCERIAPLTSQQSARRRRAVPKVAVSC